MKSREQEQRRALNEYLAAEFGIGEGADHVSDAGPFALAHVRSFVLMSQSTHVFEFQHEGMAYFAVAGAPLSFYPAAGMSAADLEIQFRGAAWIAEQDPIDSNSSAIGDERVPSAVERRSRLRAIAIAQTGREDSEVLEGLFLRKTGMCLALVQTCDGTAVVVSDQGSQRSCHFQMRRLGAVSAMRSAERAA